MAQRNPIYVFMDWLAQGGPVDPRAVPFVHGLPHFLTHETPEELALDVVTRARILTIRFALSNLSIKNFLRINGAFDQENRDQLHAVLRLNGLPTVYGGGGAFYREEFVKVFKPEIGRFAVPVHTSQYEQYGLLKNYRGVIQALTDKQRYYISQFNAYRHYKGIEFAPSPPVPLLPLRTP